MNIAAVVDRFAAVAMDVWKMLSSMTSEKLVIVLLGAVAAAISLGCVVGALIGEWREWGQTHIYRRDRD